MGRLFREGDNYREILCFVKSQCFRRLHHSDDEEEMGKGRSDKSTGATTNATCEVVAALAGSAQNTDIVGSEVESLSHICGTSVTDDLFP